MKPQEQRLQNDVDGLAWLHDFGWLRTHELGGLLWPNNSSARHQADRLVRSWRERGLVLERVLPERAGRAIVLAASGVRLLAAEGIRAASGKDVGETRGQHWMPPSTWRHDLLAAKVLVDLYQRGFDVYPEPYLRRHSGHMPKLPDGLAVRDEQVVWLEVEMSRKTGPSMRALAEMLCCVSEGTAAMVGLRPTHVMVAFSDGQLDERGHVLSHRERVTNAVAQVARKAVAITWVKYTNGIGTGKIEYEQVVISADRASAILKCLDAAGWREEGCLVSNYGKQVVYVWEDDETGCWAWQIDDRPAGRAMTISEAKRCAAEQLAIPS